MPKVSRDSAPQRQDAGPVVDLRGELDGYTVSLATSPPTPRVRQIIQEAGTGPSPTKGSRVERLAGIEPATPSLPSMRGWFTLPCSTSRSHTTAQVGGAAEGWVVGWREAARSAISGKSLARAVRGRLC